ncbi:MAG: hypothetical protein E6R13_07160 [Spirochaetes bacterium]|nr:MAG: hypothetical protein E6R13_07160 [Spirochaetota bacterium]
MFNTKKADYKPLNADNILEIVPEEEIYKYYLHHDFELGRCYKSILRKDKIPSLNFYYNASNRLCYKDFGHSQGNVFEFVKNLHECSYFEALQIINKDFNLGLGNSSISSLPTPTFKKESTILKPEKTTLIQVKVQNFTDFDIQYWLSYGITKETLVLYNVYSVSQVYLNKQLRFVYTKDNPIYAFVFNNKVKVYRPFSNLKWLNNAGANVLQGIDQLPETGELLIITKSLKDVMLFKELNFNAIAPQGESMAFDFSVIEDLKKRFNKIVVVYDNDDPGVRFSIKLTSTLNLKYWNIPKQYEEKDPTDFYKKYGKEETIKLLNSIQLV